ncbi:MAG: GHKL domain-containing protein [Clostridia bacterium]|nr:GHKL domain-containing protein [Clostridia bacterium]
MNPVITVCVHLIEWWICYIYFGSIFETKRPRAVVIAGGIGLHILLMLHFIFFYNAVRNMLLYTLTDTVIVLLFYRARIVKGLLSALLLQVICNATEYLTLRILTGVSSAEFESYMHSLPHYVLVAFVSKTLYLLFAVLTARVVFRRGSGKSDDRAPAFLFIFPIAVALTNISVWLITDGVKLTARTQIVMIASAAVLFVSMLLTFSFYSSAMRRSRELVELRQAAEKVEIDRQYYAILERQNEEVRARVHDEKNHLTALQSMNDAGEMHAYIAQVLGTLPKSAPVGNTNNKMLDLTLGKYDTLCRMQAIRFSYAAVTANLSFMDDADLVSLVGNLLDNAVEGAVTAEDKFIDLRLERHVEGMTTLTVENSSGRAPIADGQRLRSTKPDSERHGTGIKNIRRTAKKYGGSYEWTWDDSRNVFTAAVVFEA